MIKGKVHQIFSESIKKLNLMISNLDKQVGLSSDVVINSAKENTITIETTKTITPSKEQQKNLKEKAPKTDKPKEVKTDKPKEAKAQVQKQPEDPTVALFKDADLRVGKVVELKNKEGSDSIYELKVDLGEKNLRTIGTGLRKYVSADEILGSKVIVFANLKPKKLGNLVSEGMVLCSYTSDEKNFELPRPHAGKINL